MATFPQIAGMRSSQTLAAGKSPDFFNISGINNVNPISPGFNLMNQNEALAHKSVARCHLRASQLKLWGTLLLIHYAQTLQLSVCGFISGVGLSWARALSAAGPKCSPRRRFISEIKAKQRFGQCWWEDETLHRHVRGLSDKHCSRIPEWQASIGQKSKQSHLSYSLAPALPHALSWSFTSVLHNTTLAINNLRYSYTKH